MGEGNRLSENTPGAAGQNAVCPQPAMRGTQQMGLPRLWETFGSLSHTDSLERLVRGCWEKTSRSEEQRRAENPSQEAEHTFPKILPEALSRC